MTSKSPSQSALSTGRIRTKRILVLVLTVDQEPWRTIETEGQRATWAATSDGEIPIFWLYGRTGGVTRFLLRASNKTLQAMGAVSTLARFRHLTGSLAARRPVREQGDKVYTQVPETQLGVNPKTRAGLRHILETHDFDYLLRTNTSTYVNLKLLAEFVAGLPDESYYGGFIGESNGVRFASGTCALLSRDAVQTIVADAAWQYEIIDDVAIGWSMRRAGLEVQPIHRIDVHTSEDLGALGVETLRSTFVVRCKGLDSRQHDVAAMRRVHELYGEAGLT